MTKSVLRWSTADSETSPDESFSVENSDVVEIAFLESCTLFTTTGALHVLLIEVETTVDDQVGADQDGAVALSGAWSRAGSIRLPPCHHL